MVYKKNDESNMARNEDVMDLANIERCLLTLSLRGFFLTLKPYRPIYGTLVAKGLTTIRQRQLQANDEAHLAIREKRNSG